MLFANPFDIIKKVETMYYLKPGDVLVKDKGYRKGRDGAVKSEARAIAMYVTREVTPYSLLDIADHFDRDHSSVIHNCKKIEKIVQEGGNTRVNTAILILRNTFKAEQYEKRNISGVL